MTAAKKLSDLHAALVTAGIDGFVLPMADEYLGEYVPACARRLEWLTGFSGSAGAAAVLADKAAFFTDGRYTLQAHTEVNVSLYTQFNTAQLRPEVWLSEHAKPGARIGYDPMLHSMAAIEQFSRALKEKNITLVPLVPNPVDALWHDRPAPPAGAAFVHALAYAGVPHEEKRAAAAKALREADAAAALLSASDSVNWLFNIRGRDLRYTPVVLAYALLDVDGRATLFADPQKFPAAVRQHLGMGVSVAPQERLPEALASLGVAKKRVLLDPKLTPAWFAEALAQAGAEVVRGEDPCVLPKAIKNTDELEGMRQAHRRDGLAVVRFLSWLESEIKRRRVSEMDAAARLLECRRAAPEFFSPSFETIAGSGPNGAIVHYRVSEATNRMLEDGELFLLDSGGQYADGTTDITRTIAIGKPSAEMRERFTRVLKGHIRLAMARFPEGTTGGQLDALAREALWQEGQDYDHGTGHGVGSFLSVHEGPQRISKRGGDAPLAAGMIVSNEPGYYKEGAYGIRIESLVAVVPRGKMESGGTSFGFETLTCVPIDRKLIAPRLLARAEKRWLNEYHAWVYATHAPQLKGAQKRWLRRACRVIL